MKKIPLTISSFALLFAISSCTTNTDTTNDNAASTTTTAEVGGGQSAVSDDVSQKNVVQVAVGSKDHSTLVAAVKQAELVDALSNAGPFTVFAPTNAAFDALPKGTVDELMQDKNKEKLTDILQYHVFVGVMREEMMADGQRLGQVNGGNITLSKKEDGIYINNAAKIVAAVPAANGIVYVIDKVLLPE